MADRGRPPFKPTAAQRRKVEELVSCGMNERDVASVIGISIPTARLHFAEELQNGRAKKRAEVIGMLYRSAKSGNVSAQRKLTDMTSVSAAAAEWESEEAAPGRRVGKKEEAAAAAETAGDGTEWGDDLRFGNRLN